MTFIGSTPAVGHGRLFPAPRKSVCVSVGRRGADEDGARRALGPDPAFPDIAAVGTTIEHLARIALG